MLGINSKKFKTSVVASGILLSISVTSSFALPATIELTDGGTTAADAISDISTINTNQTHTITGSNSALSGTIEGKTDGVGTIIIDGNINLTSYNLGTSSNSLEKLIINSGKTLSLDGKGVSIDATNIILGGTLSIEGTSNTVVGKIDGSSAGVGTLNINSANDFNTNGDIGSIKAIGNINIGEGANTARTFNANHNITSKNITFVSEYDHTLNVNTSNITADLATDYDGRGILNINQDTTFSGKIGTSTKALNNITIALDKTLTLGGDVFNNPVYANTISINSGSSIIIDATNSVIKDGASITVISANMDPFISITGPIDTAMIDYTTELTSDDDAIIVSAAYASASNLGVSDESEKIYNNAKSVIESNTEVFKALNNASSSSQRDKILSSLKSDGSFNSIVGGTDLSNSTGGTISTELALRREYGQGLTGISSGDASFDNQFWVQAFGNKVNQSDRNGKSGYDADGYGIVFGLDKFITDDIVYGVALSRGNSDVSNNLGNSDTDIQSVQLSTYYSHKLANDYFFEGILSYAKNDNSSSRKIISTPLTATASFDSEIYGLKISAGKEIKFDTYKVIPKASINYMYITTDKYTETGARTANLTVDTDDINKAELYLGSTIVWDKINFNGGRLIPEVSLGLTQDIGNSTSSSTSTFNGGGTFTAEGLDAASTSLDTGFGIAYKLPNQLSEIRFDYDLKVKSDYDSHAGFLTFKHKF